MNEAGNNGRVMKAQREQHHPAHSTMNDQQKADEANREQLTCSS